MFDLFDQPLLILQSIGQAEISLTAHQLVEPAVYNVPLAMRLLGSVKLDVLEHALNEIVRRHEALRTTFVTIENLPVQRILPTLTVSLDVIDLMKYPEIRPRRRERAMQRLQAEAMRPFDLSAGPLFRATVFRVGTEEHLLLINLHHIVSDGWSLGVLLQELEVLYNAFAAGQPSPLPPLPVQYADYAVLQRQWLETHLDEQLDYWKAQLRNLSVVELPADRPRPAVQTFRGASTRRVLSPELLTRLNGVGQQEGVTLYMILLAAFQTLLHRETGLDTIAVGSAFANRTRHEVEALIGFFVSTLVMNTDFSGNPTLRELGLQHY